MVEGGGFEPPKSSTSDLQSDPFGHSGTPPGDIFIQFYGELTPLQLGGAGERNRTPNILITSEVLYQLSYASTRGVIYNSANWIASENLLHSDNAATSAQL